jgi:hypothetical protein
VGIPPCHSLLTSSWHICLLFPVNSFQYEGWVFKRKTTSIQTRPIITLFSEQNVLLGLWIEHIQSGIPGLQGESRNLLGINAFFFPSLLDST